MKYLQLNQPVIKCKNGTVFVYNSQFNQLVIIARLWLNETDYQNLTRKHMNPSQLTQMYLPKDKTTTNLLDNFN